MNLVSKVQRCIDAGQISVSDNLSFMYNCHCASLFGKVYHKSIQRGGIAHYPSRNDSAPMGIWFPKFFPNDQWDNKVLQSGAVILECSKTDPLGHLHWQITENYQHHVVFGCYRKTSGDVYYKFMGVYTLDVAGSIDGVARWVRISESIKCHTPEC
ncbi:hypothetical protein [Plesiomonas sp.]|uniref:hypothetical protein n=1 Tax=Plesiomonas sp. TaxID=2486279 RepID=UPI003F2E3633